MMGNVVERLPELPSTKVAVAVILIVYNPASFKLVLNAVKSN
jgi:hypothetical protein